MIEVDDNKNRFAPPHSIFSIADPSASDVPKGEDRAVRIWITTDMIGVACLPDVDGDTELSVSTSPDDVHTEPPRADVQFPTPNRAVLLEQSDLTEIMRIDVTDIVTRVRIWSNDPLYPDRIMVVIG